MDEKKLDIIKEWLGSGSINIFGVQFSGKDTVGKRLAAALGAEFISSGDIIRTTREKTDDARMVEAIKVSDSGREMPTDEFRDLILPYLYDERLDGRALILSSVGRWIGEEEPVMAALQRGGHDLKVVINLDISEAEIWQRWKIANGANDRNAGRADETAAGLQTRLDEFRDKTLPVIAKFRQMELLIEINGQATRDQVFDEVIDKLYKFIQ
ncbi:MAG: nucleoside monophosphate kinase [Candidatus Nomurabacteria bacterium]|jgi:adenylate kinase|nr:nucleoside monophosphate kinase [Candidatus Nomurabacteria bacterium]